MVPTYIQRIKESLHVKESLLHAATSPAPPQPLHALRPLMNSALTHS